MKKLLSPVLIAAILITSLVSCSVTTPGSDVDIDLTMLSSTMVYSEVLNMLQNPDEYIGKTVRMEGQFAVTQTEQRNYYQCIIADATACCANGIEFSRADNAAFPDDYPPIETEITVVGRFETYMEGASTYIEIVDAEMTY